MCFDDIHEIPMRMRGAREGERYFFYEMNLLLGLLLLLLLMETFGTAACLSISEHTNECGSHRIAFLPF